MCNKIKLQNVTERGRNDGRENAYFQCGNEGYESNLESGGDGNGAGGAGNSEEGGRGIATFLRRLTAKEILGVTKKGNKLCYFPLVSKEQYEKKEAEGFVESKFGGSLKNFLVAFRGSDKIGKNDMKDLRAWLDELDD